MMNMKLNIPIFILNLLKLMFVLLIVSCHNSGQNIQSMEKKSHNLSLEEVRAIFSKDKNLIIKQYQAQGAGIGKTEDKFVIRIYVNELKEDHLNLSWKGIPLKFIKDSTIKAY